MDAPTNGYKQERSLDFYRQLRDNLDAIPGVESAALAVIPVLAGNEWDNSMAVEGLQHEPTETPDPHMQFISPDYFKTMNIPVLMGRDFRMTDGRGAPEVCIVNEKFARKFFKEGLAPGRHIGMGGDPGTKLNIEIVGVVRDTKYESMRDEIPLEVYRPYHQTEVCLATVLLVGSGLLIRSFLRVSGIDAGFSPDHVLKMTMVLPPRAIARTRIMLDSLTARSNRRTIPGIVRRIYFQAAAARRQLRPCSD